MAALIGIVGGIIAMLPIFALIGCIIIVVVKFGWAILKGIVSVIKALYHIVMEGFVSHSNEVEQKAEESKVYLTQDDIPYIKVIIKAFIVWLKDGMDQDTFVAGLRKIKSQRPNMNAFTIDEMFHFARLPVPESIEAVYNNVNEIWSSI